MFALDLFNNDHERRLAEGAVDQLEQRRIDDLAMKMDDLVARAKQATTPEARAALVKEFQKCKDERDSYYKVQDECMGYGSLVGEENVNEGSYKNMLWKLAERMDRTQFIDHCVSELGGDAVEMGEFWDSINGPLDEAGIGQDVVNKQEKMARATPSTSASKVASTVKNAAKWLAGRGGPGKEGPTYEGTDNSEDDYEQLLNAIAALYGPEIWDNDAMGDLADDLEKASPTPEELNFIIQHGKLPKRLQGIKFTNNDTVQFGEAAYTGDYDTDEKHIQHLMRKYNWSRQEAEEHLTSSESDHEKFDESDAPMRRASAGQSERPWPGPWKPYIENGRITGIMGPNSKKQPLSKSHAQGADGLIYLWNDPRRQLAQKKNNEVTEGVDHPALQGWDNMDRTQMRDALVKAGLYTSYDLSGKSVPELNDLLHAARIKASNQSDELSMGLAGRRELQRQEQQDFEDQRRQLHKEKMEMEKFAWEKANTEAERKQEMAKIDKAYTHELDVLRQTHSQNMQKILHADEHELVKLKAEFNMRQSDREQEFALHHQGKDLDLARQQQAQQIPQKKSSKEVDEAYDPQAVHDAGLKLPITSQYTGDGQFKVTVKNKPYIVTVAGFEIDDLSPGNLDSFYLTDVATGKTEHVVSAINDPRAVAIFNNLKTNQLPALKQIYKQDMELGRRTDWDERPERLQGLPLSGYTSIPADRFVKAHQDMKKVTGQKELDEKKLGQNRPKLGTGRDIGKSVKKFRAQRGLNEGQQLHVGDPVVVTGPNEFEGSTGEIYDFAPSGKFVIVNLYNHGKHSMHLSDIAYNEYADQEQDEEDDWYDDEDTLEEANINPQFIVAQVTKLLATEARRVTNAPVAQLLAPVMQEYGLTLQQIDAMVPGGLKKAAGEYGIMMKEGFQDFNKVEPYAVCLAGKPVKKFDYYEDARRFHDNWKKKLYREGNKAKADKITLMPLDLDEATGDNKFDSMMGRIGNDPWTQLNSDPNWEEEIEELVSKHIEPWLSAMEQSGMPITKDNETLNPSWRKRYEQVSTQLAQKFLTSKKFNPRDPDLVNKIRAYIDWHTNESNSVHGQLDAYADDLPLQRHLDTPAADQQTATIRANMFPNTQDEVDDDGYATRPRPEADPRRLDPGNLEEAQINEFFVRDGDDIMSVMSLNLFADLLGQGNLSDYDEEFANSPEWQAVVAEWQPKAEYLQQQLTKLHNAGRKLRDAEADALEATVYDGSDAYESADMAASYLPQLYKKQASAIVRLLKDGYDNPPAGMHEARNGDVNFGHTVTPGSWIVHQDSKKPMRFKTHTGAKAYAEKNGGKVYSSEFYADKIRGVKEAETDYSKRRQRERDVDAGKPVAKQRQPKQTDYQKRRAEQKRQEALGEDQDTSGVERAILNRIMVAHTDLLMKFGPEKVMQAAEEVAYNVGDVDEIGTSDVSAYVHQVRQILGVPEEVNEKWSQKYKSSINCANPKGFSQKAHCAGKKK